MKNNFFLFIFLVFTNAMYSQTITFISETTNRPLSKIVVMDNEGNILAISDVEGKIDNSSIEPAKSSYELLYNNQSVGTLSYSDFKNETIKIIEKIKTIDPVIVKANDKAKHVFIRGNFNSYVTMNNKLNCYVDGVITYIFNRKNNNLKRSRLEQYRVYVIENPQEDYKKTETFDYRAFLDIVPEIKNVGNYENYLNDKKRKNREIKGDKKDEVEVSSEGLQKELAIFGYRIYDVKKLKNISYEKDSKKTLKDLLEYNEVNSIKLKHKSESNYNQITVYNNFYPVELSYVNDDESGKIKFKSNNSNYKTKFWEDPNFPNMKHIFDKHYKDQLKEQPNSN